MLIFNIAKFRFEVMKPLRPLILGTATGYTPEQISVFVRSLKKSGFKGTTTLIVNRTNIGIQSYLAQNGIEVIPVDPVPEWILGRMAGAAKRFNRCRVNLLHRMLKTGGAILHIWLRSFNAAHLVVPFHHISNSRYIYYLRYLGCHSRRFTHVLLTDVRDVAFQGDPFEGVPARCFWLFRENSSRTLSSEPWNRQWIETAYGRHEAEQIGNKSILCSGTTLGSTELIYKYLEQMTFELIRLTPKISGLLGFDQGVHNRLFWTGYFPEADLKDNYEGPVATLQLETPDRFRFDDAGRLLNLDGSPVALLHQYDRHPILVEKVAAQEAVVDP